MDPRAARVPLGRASRLAEASAAADASAVYFDTTHGRLDSLTIRARRRTAPRLPHRAPIPAADKGRRSKVQTNKRQSPPADFDTPNFTDALTEHSAQQSARKAALGSDYQDHDLVCCVEDGAIWKPSAFTSAYRDLLRRRKIRNIRFHDLRHSHASQLLRAGVNPKVISERLGHSKVAFTLDVYSHLLPGMQEEAATKTDAGLRAALARKPSWKRQILLAVTRTPVLFRGAGSGVPLNLVQHWLGHAHLSTTAIYADATSAEGKHIAERMWHWTWV
jgi:hypothetical protein